MTINEGSSVMPYLVCVSILPSIFLYAINIHNYSEYCVAHASGQLNGSSPPTSWNGNELSGVNILWSRLIASGPSEQRQHERRYICSQNGDNESLYLHGFRASDFPRSRKSRGIRGIADLKWNLENSNFFFFYFLFFLMSVAHGF